MKEVVINWELVTYTDCPYCNRWIDIKDQLPIKDVEIVLDFQVNCIVRCPKCKKEIKVIKLERQLDNEM